MKRTLSVLLAGFLVFAFINSMLNQTAQAAPRAQEIDLPTPSPTLQIEETPSATSTPTEAAADRG